ncbi:uncharacterized protein LAESUDRAFT_680336 [Laetiporus sulphureus 93-53]|uniref:N-acetyltransferase domain-containing protein n=1 Tax=Laetiporus sulphureus 93-53 TaxID=1314785 RepID=A0A165DXV1_9APHY|nr:uncharacterized protein LAESUDRAFT_680336 [Laetiporus sulphureus 93-53]KZT05843.1 hypothetical protein LAESUDRAFT_680336 [Laetiporus sulphureus 93-53]
MPSVSASYVVKTYTSANDLPAEVWQAFDAHARDSNIVYPFAKKARLHERSRGHHRGADVWLVCYSHQHGSGTPSVDFVLSCTEGPFGPYPVFIFTPIPSTKLDPHHFLPRLEVLAYTLQQAVPPERVFSVFALETITRAFAAIWMRETGIPLDPEPEYYAAKFTYCTKETIKFRQTTTLSDVSYQLRLATETDIQDAAKLCFGFAATSEPFVLSKEQAVQEAAYLIQNGQLWVHEITTSSQRPEIASIVAVTRTSDTVAGITKVFTNPRWRQRGCAERLTRFVCQRLLETKESVVLYVAHNNPAAAKVYHRVGFVGLSGDEHSTSTVDDWLELGFERDLVDLGHW